jgi:hypothetical protein
MSEPGTTKDQVFEPCYCSLCRGSFPAPCRFAGKNWLQLVWLRIWCTLDDHGGITNDHRCKRCGAKVRV